MKTRVLEITGSNESAGGPDKLGETGEQDPGLPGFGVHLGEHSSNPGVKRRKEKSAGCLGHGGNGGRAQLYRGYVCLVAEVRGLSGICEGKNGTIGVCPRFLCVRKS